MNAPSSDAPREYSLLSPRFLLSMPFSKSYNVKPSRDFPTDGASSASVAPFCWEDTNLQKQHLFGWLEKPLSLKSTQFEISPVTHFDDAINIISEHPTHDAWFEMPPSSIRFELPSTHYLEVDSNTITDDLAILLISVLGFLQGLNLKPYGVGHLHRTPRQSRTLVEFSPSLDEVENVLRTVLIFYANHGSKPDVMSLMNAALHWYMTSQSYDHHFEQFAWQYTVLDNLHKLASKIDRKFSDGRIAALARYYGVNLHIAFSDPDIPQKNTKALTDCRNKLIHEALWCNQPIGYAVSQTSYAILRSLRRFNSQLILASLGVKCRFLEADDDRQLWPLAVL